jgi:hypothetical protein
VASPAPGSATLWGWWPHDPIRAHADAWLGP